MFEGARTERNIEFIDDAKDEIEKRMTEIYTGRQTIMVNMVTEPSSKCYLPASIRQLIGGIKNFKLRPDDVWVLSYPKNGTTWTQEMMWQLMNKCDQLDTKDSLVMRSIFLELSLVGSHPSITDPNLDTPLAELARDPKRMMESIMANSINRANESPSPRVLKSHLPLSLLPDNLLQNCGHVVWVTRNPRDTCVSFFHHERLLPNHGLDHKNVDVNRYAKELFMEGKVAYGNYWDRFKEIFKLRNHPKVTWIKFEDMKSDLESVIRNLETSLALDPLSVEKMKLLCEHLDFKAFKSNDACNFKPPVGMVPEEVRSKFNFIRSGKVGDWQSHFSVETDVKFKEWNEKNLKGETEILKSLPSLYIQ